MKKIDKKLKEKYSFKNYNPNPKLCKPITYKGTTYKSKMQCKVLNNLTDKELNEYLKENN